MILPDVSLLIQAHNGGSSHHEQARDWWDAVLSGTELVALPWVTLLGFIRLTTNRTIFERPLPLGEVLWRVEAWLAQPNVRIVHPTERHSKLLFHFLRTLGTAGNLTTDAHVAALAVEHGCTLYSTDADFARFPGLRWSNPITSRRSRAD